MNQKMLAWVFTAMTIGVCILIAAIAQSNDSSLVVGIVGGVLIVGAVIALFLMRPREGWIVAMPTLPGNRVLIRLIHTLNRTERPGFNSSTIKTAFGVTPVIVPRPLSESHTTVITCSTCQHPISIVTKSKQELSRLRKKNVSIDGLALLVFVGLLFADNWLYTMNPQSSLVAWIGVTLLGLIGSFLIKLFYDVTFWGITIQPSDGIHLIHKPRGQEYRQAKTFPGVGALTSEAKTDYQVYSGSVDWLQPK